MAFFSSLRIAAAILLLAGAGAAQAQTPQEIQAQIANGQAGQALNELTQILQTHPHSGIAWYLTAEAQDALGNETAARSALATAEAEKPGLPFAKPDDVAALQAHLNATPHHGGGMGHVVLIIAVLAGLFILIRFLLRARRPVPMGYGEGYGGGYGGGGFPGQPGYPPAPGGGLGSSIISGLAAGAGFAAGERIIDDITGNRSNDYGQPFNQDPPARDDGLSGSPGWDDNNNDNFDPDNNW